MVFERVTLRLFLAQTLEFLGSFAELQELTRDMLRDALARGDIYASVIARTGGPNLAWLAEDRPQLAEDNAAQAMRDWTSHGFHLEHVFAFFARIRARLYAGDGSGAHALASECRQRSEGSLLGRIQVLRARTAYFRGTSALLCVERGVGDRGALLREAEQDARALAREGTSWTAPFGGVIRAGIALHAGDRSAAVAGLDAAARGFDGADMHGYAAAARERGAQLREERSAEATADMARAMTFFRAENVVAPQRMVAMLVPGLGVAKSPG
jgi:hypothetical protein